MGTTTNVRRKAQGATSSQEAQQTDQARPIWNVLAEMAAAVPGDQAAKLPADLAQNLDRYLYGASARA